MKHETLLLGTLFVVGVLASVLVVGAMLAV